MQLYLTIVYVNYWYIMKILIATLVTTAIILPGTASAGHCMSKGYNKHKDYGLHGSYHPYANQHGKYMMKRHYRGHYPHGQNMSQKSQYGHHGYKPHSPHHAGANMYLHLPKDNHSATQSEPPKPVTSPIPNAAEADNNQLTDLLSTAGSAGQFNTLIEAVKSAGLESTLTGEGPFTVFAPTDEAFSRLPESILKALTEDTQALTDLLTTHIISGEVKAADVAGLESAQSVQGSTLAITTSDSVRINGAKVISTDIQASNGIIHVIDSVIFPQS